MTYKPRRERRARGGKAVSEPLHLEHGHQYNAQGSPEEHEENAESDGFKRGGMAKKHHRKEGGHVEGHGAKHHLGKRARGGAAAHPHHGMHHETKREEHREEEKKEHKREERARGGHVKHEHKKEHHHRAKHARGGAPFSAGHHMTPNSNDKTTGPGENTESIP